jgi:endonuclease-3
MMDEHYWDALFERFQASIAQERRTLPSVSLIAEERQDPYHVLLSTLISLRTKDEVTLASSRRLFDLASDPYQMVALSEEEIAAAIYSAGFYKTKARNIRLISEILIERHGASVPSTREELMALPGVGVKTANLTLNLGFGIEAICVDCHVHQIANRLGWIETKTPEESEAALMEIMPRRFWIPLNELLVRFGQVICRPVSPFCSKCPEHDRCPKVGVTTRR